MLCTFVPVGEVNCQNRLMRLVLLLEFTVRGAEPCLLHALVSFPGIFNGRLSCVLMENWQNSLWSWHENPAPAGHDAEVQRWRLVVDLLFCVYHKPKYCIRTEPAAIRSNWTLNVFLHSCGTVHETAATIHKSWSEELCDYCCLLLYPAFPFYIAVTNFDIYIFFSQDCLDCVVTPTST